MHKSLNLEMKQFGSVPMHMCALGVEKSLILRTKVLVNRKTKAGNELWCNLTNCLNQNLKVVDKTSLDWCLTMSFSGKDPQKMRMVNWESNHCLAFMRLSLFNFGTFDGDTDLLQEKNDIFASFKCVHVLCFAWCQVFLEMMTLTSVKLTISSNHSSHRVESCRLFVKQN